MGWRGPRIGLMNSAWGVVTVKGVGVALITIELAVAFCCRGTAKRINCDIINYTWIINNAKNYKNSIIFFLSLSTIFPTTIGFAPRCFW